MAVVALAPDDSVVQAATEREPGIVDITPNFRHTGIALNHRTWSRNMVVSREREAREIVL